MHANISLHSMKISSCLKFGALQVAIFFQHFRNPLTKIKLTKTFLPIFLPITLSITQWVISQF